MPNSVMGNVKGSAVIPNHSNIPVIIVDIQ